MTDVQLTHKLGFIGYRNHAKKLIDVAEKKALELGSNFIHLDVRETQEAAIKLFEAKGYKKWGTNPFYAFINGQNLRGHYFFKQLK